MRMAAILWCLWASVSQQGSDSERPDPALRERVGQTLARLVQAAETLPDPSVAPIDHCLREGLLHVQGADDPQRELLALFLAMAVLVDGNDQIADHPRLRPFLVGLETDETRARRKQAASSVRLNERQDLARHFFLAAALSRIVGSRMASKLGLAREVEDAGRLENGTGTGFSFADLCANEAGIRFSDELRTDLAPERCGSLRLTDFMPSVEGLDEGLTTSAFEEQYGGLRGDRFELRLASLRARIGSCAAYRPDVARERSP